MAKADFLGFAETVARDEGNLQMLPVIEKELLHYEILNALDARGLLDGLTFQGGTCLRLCYGAERYSEDLDFVGGSDLNSETAADMKKVIEGALTKRYTMEVSVSDKIIGPDDSGVTIKRWQVKVVTAPERRDIPLQRISIELASVPAHTSIVRPIMVNYDALPASFANVLLRVETLEEICADKLKAFLTAPYIRYRDLWDMYWISRRPKLDRTQIPSLLQCKLDDYGQRAVAREHADRIEGIPELAESKEFLDQMRRFLPVSVLASTLERPMFQESLADTVMDLYASLG